MACLRLFVSPVLQAFEPKTRTDLWQGMTACDPAEVIKGLTEDAFEQKADVTRANLDKQQEEAQADERWRAEQKKLEKVSS